MSSTTTSQKLQFAHVRHPITFTMLATANKCYDHAAIESDRHNGGELNYYTQEFLIKPFKKGDSKSAIAFVEYLLTQYPKSRISLIWDGASYHRSVEFQDYLKSVNQGLNENEWKVTCIRFAPNDPTQNPVEDIWLSAKKFVREFYHLCKSFTIVKRLFELAVHHEIFNFPKIFMYN